MHGVPARLRQQGGIRKGGGVPICFSHCQVSMPQSSWHARMLSCIMRHEAHSCKQHGFAMVIGKRLGLTSKGMHREEKRQRQYLLRDSSIRALQGCKLVHLRRGCSDMLHSPCQEDRQGTTGGTERAGCCHCTRAKAQRVNDPEQLARRYKVQRRFPWNKQAHKHSHTQSWLRNGRKKERQPNAVLWVCMARLTNARQAGRRTALSTAHNRTLSPILIVARAYDIIQRITERNPMRLVTQRFPS